MSEERQTTTLMTKSLPTDGALVSGFSVQGDMTTVTQVAKVDLRKAINGRIAGRLKLLTAATAAYNAAVELRNRAMATIEVPAEMFKDAEPIAKAMLKFRAGAHVRKRDEDKGKEYVSSANVNLNAETFSAAVTIADPEHGSMWTATRTYPIPQTLKDLQAAVVDAESNVSGFKGDVQVLRQSLAGLDDKIEELSAAVTRKGLEATTSGTNALSAMDAIVAATMAGLDKDMSTDSRDE